MNRVRLVLSVLVALSISACGDEAVSPNVSPEGGMDAAQPNADAGQAPMCGPQHCGSPLVGTHCCTAGDDVAAGVAGLTARCGTDLGVLVTALAGRCVELRRAGALDDQCPNRRVGAGVEPGCCMPEGRCGTFNAAADLGCQPVLMSADLPLFCGPISDDAGLAGDAD